VAHKLEWKRVIDKIDEWAAWQGANAKIDKISLSILKKFINISKEAMEDYNFGYVYTCNGLFQKCASLKKLILEHFFTSLLNDLSIED
jgi:hypothetical protein